MEIAAYVSAWYVRHPNGAFSAEFSLVPTRCEDQAAGLLALAGLGAAPTRGRRVGTKVRGKKVGAERPE